jgi:pseudaminic acid cytidylyltransferase
MMKRIAVIPARGGSKRIPRKNIKDFAGKPLIQHTIEKAKASGIFDEIYVSTDDGEIKEISISAGALVPFLRSNELSGDNVMTVPVISNFIKEINIDNETPVCCIYPTAPLLIPDNLTSGLDLLYSNLIIDYVLGVTKYNYPIQRALIEGENGEFTMLNRENLETRSQDLKQMWHDTGTFYWAFAKTWMGGNSMLFNCAGIKIPSYLVQDIDDEEDWIRAEQLYKLNFL